MVANGPALESRWQLYRLLSDPFRLRLLALTAEEELSVGELSDLLEESQPNVSRHTAPLRQAGLLTDRRQGARTLIRLAESAASDPVVADALGAGRGLCRDDGSLSRVPEIVRLRDARTREFFARPGKADEILTVAPELPAYLLALGAVIGQRELALDAGTGDGRLLDVLAPLYRRVVALDRSEVQLGRALRLVRARDYSNVELVRDEVDGPAIKEAIGVGADVVIASRMLHHAPLPRSTLQSLTALARPGGNVLIVDFVRHEDEQQREQQADVWMGFDADELAQYARAAGLADVRVLPVPAGFVSAAADGHLGWHILVATRPTDETRVATNSRGIAPASL
jgi:ArsR family transcriptional regulator